MAVRSAEFRRADPATWVPSCGSFKAACGDLSRCAITMMPIHSTNGWSPGIASAASRTRNPDRDYAWTEARRASRQGAQPRSGPVEEASLILIVDDEPTGRCALESLLLGQGFALAFAAGGLEAIELAGQLEPDLILLDVMMPGMDGRECLRRLRMDPRLAEIPVVMVSALDDRASRVAGLEAGADGYVAKPFERSELRAQIHTILRLNRYRKLRSALHSLQQAYDETLEGWVRAIDLREHELEGHSQRVTGKMDELARFMGVEESELIHIRRGALLHDVGKIAVPDAILNKPGPLTDEEWVIMRKHPEHGRALLEPIAYLRPAIDIPLGHHERFDGQGYPHGLSGMQIPLPARMFSVVDVWDALSSDRPYRRAWPVDRVRSYIWRTRARPSIPRSSRPSVPAQHAPEGYETDIRWVDERERQATAGSTASPTAELDVVPCASGHRKAHSGARSRCDSAIGVGDPDARQALRHAHVRAVRSR